MATALLDYHKLRYFWNAAHHGSLAAAARAMGVSQPTVSTQVQLLESQIGGLLFERKGRRLQLTDRGKLALRYADQIFDLGAELERSVAGELAETPDELRIGVGDGVPKLVVRSLLQPALDVGPRTRLECREWRPDILLAELKQNRLDVVIADAPPGGPQHARLLGYEAGRSGVVLLGTSDLASPARRNFPRSLSGMPFVLPVPESPLRRSLDIWFDANGVSPRVIAEVDDRALLNHFGQAGIGLFPAAQILESELCRQYMVARVSVLKNVREKYTVLTSQRRLRHPGVAAICQKARQQFTAATSR
ncbi:MAG: LysR family transcriptional regulator [Phycisphaeraceae bacterium]|nr:LysR family transcriptional regulator [Phycisphaeraceae bacterium]